MSNLRVLVVGASIAGPMTAYWLAKAGAHVTVIERFPNLRTGGQQIDIRTAGVTVMRKIPGMEGAVRAKTVKEEGIHFVNESGKPFATIRPSGNPDQQTLISEYEIFRGDLSKILYDMTCENEKIKYVFGEQVTSLKQDGDGPVKVEFMNGMQKAEYDLVVACDGATSRTRALGLECGLRDYVHPLNTWIAYFSFEKDLFGGSRTGHSYNTVGGRWVAGGSDPEGNGTRAMMWGIYPKKDRDAILPFREALKLGDDEVQRYITKRYEGVGWKTPEILKGMMTSKDLYAAELVQVRPPTIIKGRFAMVGDAGYAPGPTGGGTSLAIAGAYLLAGEILSHDGDLAAGLKGYEERIRPIITDLQKIPPGIPNILAPQTAWRLWLRNSILRFISWSGIVEWGGKFFASGFGKDKYNIPEYKWVE